MNTKKKYVCLPALIKKEPTNLLYCSYEAYVALLCEVPYGKLITEKMLAACLEKIYGYKNLPIDYSPFVSYDMNELKYPFWRLVSQNGHLLNWKEKDLQEKMLSREGHVIDRPKPNESGLVVRNYKDKLFSPDSLHITVRPDPAEHYRLLEAFAKSKNGQ